MYYNAHAHCFTLDDVPEDFAKPIKTSDIKKIVEYDKLLRFLASNLPLIGNAEIGKRIGQMALEAKSKTQEEMIRKMLDQYADDGESIRVVMLTMDMWYMAAGNPERSFEDQVEELIQIKNKPEYADVVYPFYCIDPRRANYQPGAGQQIRKIAETFVSAEKKFQGIKIYPALGFWPFDSRLIDMYVFARDNAIPIMTHCAQGPVYYRGDQLEEWKKHPVTGKILPRIPGEHFSSNFTSPLNYECLMNRELLQKYYDNAGIQETAPDLSKLKICIAHFGGGHQWKRYTDNKTIAGSKWYQHLWLKSQTLKTKDFSEPAGASLNTDNWNTSDKPFTWLTMTCDLIRKYPNVYTDISSTLADNSFIDLLIEILNSEQKIQDRVMFGTDYYVVGNRATEDEFTKDLRKALGEKLFYKIAVTNVEGYLQNAILPVKPIAKADGINV